MVQALLHPFRGGPTGDAPSCSWVAPWKGTEPGGAMDKTTPNVLGTLWGAAAPNWRRVLEPQHLCPRMPICSQVGARASWPWVFCLKGDREAAPWILEGASSGPWGARGQRPWAPPASVEGGQGLWIAVDPGSGHSNIERHLGDQWPIWEIVLNQPLVGPCPQPSLPYRGGGRTIRKRHIYQVWSSRGGGAAGAMLRGGAQPTRQWKPPQAALAWCWGPRGWGWGTPWASGAAGALTGRLSDAIRAPGCRHQLGCCHGRGALQPVPQALGRAGVPGGRASQAPAPAGLRASRAPWTSLFAGPSLGSRLTRPLGQLVSSTW